MKKVSTWVLLLVILLSLNLVVVFGWLVHRALIVPTFGNSQIGEIILKVAVYPSLVKNALEQTGILTNDQTLERPQVVPNDFPDLDGFFISNWESIQEADLAG